jgi:hypothetical protein
MAAKPTAVKATKTTANLPVDINAMFAAEVASVHKRIHQPTGQWVKVEGKEFVLPDGRRFPALDAVIVDFICANNYYDSDYVEGEQNSPSCFALSFDVDEMSPSKSIAAPISESCTSCANKAWGSHRNGRGGKACDDNRNYVIMEPSSNGDEPKLYLIKASKTAVKAFDAYVNEVASTHNRPLRGVMTRIGFDTQSKYPSQRWSCLGPADNALVLAAQSKLDEAKRMLSVEPSLVMPEAENDPKVAKKAVGGRKR